MDVEVHHEIQSLGKQLENITNITQERKLDLNKIPVPKTLTELCDNLRDVFSNSSVNVEYVKQLITNYEANPKEWKPFVKYDPHKYTRCMVDSGNGKYNILMLCWAESQASIIHDHSDAHCFMKCLSGELHETQYQWPEYKEDESEVEGNKMIEIGSKPLRKNEVAYINDEIGLHRIENKSHSKAAISLHVYIPPFTECRGFDINSGKHKVCQVTFN